MKFCLVSPGFIEIPPKSWGAVEIIIWDYAFYLNKYGHEVKIVNSKDKNETLNQINEFKPDVCHCHYDVYYDILNECDAKLKIMTSHCGAIRSDLNNNDYDNWFRTNILPNLNSQKFYNFCLDKCIHDLYIKHGFDIDRLKINPNAARSDLIKYKEVPNTNDTICLGLIQRRKRQHLLSNLNVFFIGNTSPDSPMQTNKRMIGSWTKDYIYDNLTDNANLILLSDSEAAPLVVLEGLMAGLGVVLSENSTANMDLTKPFIDVIPEKYINDEEYLNFIINKNKHISLKQRNSIRNYAIENHSYDVIIPNYLNMINSIISNS